MNECCSRCIIRNPLEGNLLEETVPVPARQQLGNPGRRRGPAQPGGISCSPAAPRCVTRARRDPHLVLSSRGGSRWGQMESHQEHTGTRTSQCPRCPCLAVVPAWLSAAGGGQGDAGGRCRALPTLLLPISDTQSIPMLPSAPSAEAMESPPLLTPTVPSLSTPTVFLG